MLEFIKQSKKRKLYCILGILYLLCIIFVANDAWLYSTPIAKLTKVETSVSGEETGTRGTKEKKYKQNIQGVILNGENKGKTISFTNEYTYTGMTNSHIIREIRYCSMEQAREWVLEFVD